LFGYEVIVTHDAPADRDAGPNLLKLSESFLLQHRPRTIALISVREENAGADEAEKCRNCLDHRIDPLAPLCRTETTGAAAQSKGFPTACKNRNPTDDLEQHRGPEKGEGRLFRLLGLRSCGFLRARCHHRVIFRSAAPGRSTLRQAAHPMRHVGDRLARRSTTGASR
jgi:hypothetical protein